MPCFSSQELLFLNGFVLRSEAKDLLGDDWVQRHRRVVQQHANQYKRNAWAKVQFYFTEHLIHYSRKCYNLKFILNWLNRYQFVET